MRYPGGKVRRGALPAFCFFGIFVAAFLVEAEAGPIPLTEASPFHEFIAAHINANGKGDPAFGNYVTILDQGYEALLLRVHLMRSAKHSIDIQTYIWADDECARVFRHELRQAADRGVMVRIIADHIASNKDPALMAFYSTISPNLAIKIYRPLADRGRAPLHHLVFALAHPSIVNQRMHVKTFIVDGVVGITGGRNVDNNYYNNSLTYNFKDRDVLVVGPSVAAMVDSFNEYWEAQETVNGKDLKDVARRIRSGVTHSGPTRDEVYFNGFFESLDREAESATIIRRTFIDTLLPADRVTYVADAPGWKRKNFYIGPTDSGRVTRAIQGLIGNARESVIIQSPYVIVNRRLARFFRRVYDANPDLRIMISTNSYGAADHLITYAGNYRLRSRVVLKQGMEVFEYKPRPEDILFYLPNLPELEERARQEKRSKSPYLSVHAKSAVFDDDIVFIGTFNLDPRSFYLNSEDGFIIEDKIIAGILKAKILRDMAPANSWTIAKKRLPAFPVNRAIEVLSTHAPVDFWPIRSTSGFELRPGMEPMSSEDPDFYTHYKDIGNFPGGEGPSRAKFTVRFLKLIGKPTTPFL